MLLVELDELDEHLLRKVSEFSQDDHSASLNDITKDLRTIQYHLDAFDSALRPKGRPKDIVSPKLILMLANVYRDIKGEWPKRKHNPVSGNDYGDFRNFVIATVSPIDPKRASHGVDDLIRDVLKNTEPSSMLGFKKIFGPGIIIAAFRLMGINMEKIQVINPISKSPSD
jgi:hypothetical protein